MKKILSCALATMFAFGVSAQTQTELKHQDETKKVEKTPSAKMTNPEMKSDELKKDETQAGTTKVHNATPAKQEAKVNPRSDQAKRKQARKTNPLITKAPVETKSDKTTPKVK